MNIIKSTLVLLFLLWTVLHTIKYTIRTATDYKGSSRRLVGWFKISICSFLALLILTSLYDYIWPFDRSLTPVLVAEMDIPEERTLDYPGQKKWHGAYKASGIFPESLYFNPNDLYTWYGDPWPHMDFDRYNYIISYGQKIKSISYNVWDVIKYPSYNGAKSGYVEFCEEFNSNKIYIYRIPKIRIDNAELG